MAEKKERLFDKLYNAKEEFVKAMQKPSREKMIKRVAERIGDEVQDKRNQYEVDLSDLEHKLVNEKDEDVMKNIYLQIVNRRRGIEEAEAIAAEVISVKNRIFGPAK